jgi:glycosidase
MKILLSLIFALTGLIMKGQTYSVTFQCDMHGLSFSPLGVHIAGDFASIAGLGNNWNPGAIAMNDADNDSIFTFTTAIPNGVYQYKYINGNQWGMDENPPADCSVGSTFNRTFTVNGGDLVLLPVRFNQCLPSVRFAVDMSNEIVSAQGVYVSGNFLSELGYSDWQTGIIPLFDWDHDNTWEAKVEVPEGNYFYRYYNGNTISDGEIVSPPCGVPDENFSIERSFGTQSSLLPQPVCFGSCDYCDGESDTSFESHWWNDAVFYEIFVRSFYDSDGDGIGDFQGIIQKLDYLNDNNPATSTDLGIKAIWLMPTMPSPSYHGYDVTDYYSVNPDYGNMADFQELLDSCHARGIRVILDFVMNHTSDQHPWFQQSENNTNGYRDWYIWNNSNPGTTGPWGQTVWHPGNGSYYYGLFWSGMPDLNYNHPPVVSEMMNIATHWLNLGVDGYRLDAIKYLVEENGILENTPGTFHVIENLRSTMDAASSEAFSVGEAWQSTQQIIPYLQPNELNSCFEFDLANAILNGILLNSPEIIAAQLDAVRTSYPRNQFSTFLTNHDINRSASLLSGDLDYMRQAASLYLTMPGVPFVYYGEEIGMTGAGNDENKRRPMQWNSGSNVGFTTSTPWYPAGDNAQTNNVLSMNSDAQSLLNYYRKLIAIRNDFETLRRGYTTLAASSDSSILSYARIRGNESTLIISHFGDNERSMPSIEVRRSSMQTGTYWVRDLINNNVLGNVEVDSQGGFNLSNFASDSLGRHETKVWHISEDSGIGINERSVKSPFAIYPNPASNSFTVSGLGEATNIHAYNMCGQKIKTIQPRSSIATINCADWPNGIYAIAVSGYTQIVVIEH